MDRPVDVFISFVPEDIDWARRLADSLSAVDLRALHNARLLESTDTPPDSVSDVVLRAKHLIVIWSSAARGNERIYAEARAFAASARNARQRSPERRIVFMDVGGGRPVVPDVDESLVVTIPAPGKDIPPLAIPQEQWDDLVDQVLEHVSPDRTSATKVGKKDKKQRAQQRFVTRERVPVIPEGFKLYHSVRDIFEHTKELGGPPSGALLLAAISDRGQAGIATVVVGRLASTATRR